MILGPGSNNKAIDQFNTQQKEAISKEIGALEEDASSSYEQFQRIGSIVENLRQSIKNQTPSQNLKKGRVSRQASQALKELKKTHQLALDSVVKLNFPIEQGI